MEFRFQKTEIGDSVLRFRYVDSNDELLSFREVVRLWAAQGSAGDRFRLFHCGVLSHVPFKAYRWETPVVDLARFDRPFEFVTLNDPRLERSEDQSAFQQHFNSADDDQWITEFSNLGKNAVLVVPLPGGSHVNHCHLGSFMETCSAEHESRLWQQVGAAMNKRVSNVPVWLNTAGGGVAWLHIRLDNKPKYYAYRPYKAK